MVEEVEYKTRGSDGADATALVIAQGISSASNILVELIRAGQSNPLIGAVVGLVTGDMLQKLGVITETTNTEIRLLVLAGTGVAVGSEISQIISTLNPADALKNITGSQSPSLMQPSGTVFVYGSSDNSQLNALLAQIAAKKK